MDDQLIEWIRVQQTHGFSADQIRHALAENGYGQSEIDLALLDLAPEEEKHRHRSGTTAVTMVITALFLLQMVAAMIIAFVSDPLSIFIPAIFTGVFIAMLVAHRRHTAMMFALIFSPLSFGLWIPVTLSQSFLALETLAIYVGVAVHMLVLGGIAAYLFFAEDYHHLVTSGVTLSSVIAGVFVLNKGIMEVIAKLNEQVTTIFTPAVYNPDAAFIFAMILFNLPIFVACAYHEHRRFGPIMLYLIPIIIYLSLSGVVSFIIAGL